MEGSKARAALKDGDELKVNVSQLSSNSGILSGAIRVPVENIKARAALKNGGGQWAKGLRANRTSGIPAVATRGPYAGKVQESPKQVGAAMTKSVTRQICGIDADKLTRLSSIRFNVANVAKPLASAVKVADAGNLIMMHPDETKCYIQNLESGERMKMRKERGTFVFDVIFEDTKEAGTVTLDSGAGVSVWPIKRAKEGKLLPKKKGLKMIAANGTEIRNEGQKVIKFRGIGSVTPKADESTFGRPK